MTESEGNDPRRWKGLAICLLGGFVTLLDVSIVNVALPSIRSGLPGASPEAIQWVLSGYALTFGLILVPGGRLGDVLGRRRIFILGVICFTGASMLCGFALTGLWLVIARLLQGIAGGLLTPQITALIQQLFRGRERGTAFGLFGSVVGIATAVGPLVGGLLIAAFGDTEGWRFVFFVNLPIGIITVPLALRYLPAPSHNARSQRHDFDVLGVLLLGASVIALLLPFVQEREWPGAGKWLLLVVAAALALAFVLWERRYAGRGREALVDLRLFSRRSFSLGTVLATIYFAGFTPLFFVLTLMLQNGLHYSALLAGVTGVPFALGSGLAAAVSGRLVHRFGRVLVVVGLVLVLIGLGGVVLTVATHYGAVLGWWLVAPLLVAGIGSGTAISPNQTITLSEVPVSQGGTAGGLLQVGSRMGSAVGIAAVGSIFFGTVAASHGDYSRAFPMGIAIALIFVAVALAVGIADVVADRVQLRCTRHEH